MTKNSFSKSAIRARMEETGEPYSVAARALADGATDEPTTTVVYPPSTVEGVADYGALIVFCERLALFSNMGMTLRRIFQTMVAHTEDPVLKEGIEFVVSASGEMKPSAAMRLRPNAFRGVFPELMQAYDDGFSVADSMTTMAKLYRTELEMEDRIIANEKIVYRYR